MDRSTTINPQGCIELMDPPTKPRAMRRHRTRCAEMRKWKNWMLFGGESVINRIWKDNSGDVADARIARKKSRAVHRPLDDSGMKEDSAKWKAKATRFADDAALEPPYERNVFGKTPEQVIDELQHEWDEESLNTLLDNDREAAERHAEWERDRESERIFGTRMTNGYAPRVQKTEEPMPAWERELLSYAGDETLRERYMSLSERATTARRINPLRQARLNVGVGLKQYASTEPVGAIGYSRGGGRRSVRKVG
ncbi:MAG: hypothetical protein ABIP74_03845 [Candidatus Saccharimonas sp.]